MTRQAHVRGKKVLVLLWFALSVAIPLFSQFSAPLLYNFQEDELKARLNLDEEQMGALQRLVRMLQSQAYSDRLNFKDNVAALVAAAERRLTMAENLLTSVLTDTQKNLLPEIKEQQRPHREFFLLKEILVLDQTQLVKLQTILETYKPEPMNKEEILAEYSHEPIEEQNEYLNQEVPGQRNGRIDRPVHTGRDAGDIYVEILKEKEKKKQKAIEAILTTEQKVPYTQLKEILRKEFDLRMEKQREALKDK